MPALEVGSVETGDGDERLRDLLTVRAHVLDRRGAHCPRDARETLDAGQAPVHRLPDERIPIGAGRHLHQDGVARVLKRGALQADLDDEP